PNTPRLKVLAWLLCLARLPALRELLEFGIGPLRQDDLEGHIFIPMALVAAPRALALEPQHRAGIRPFRNRHAHGTGRGGDVELRAQHRFRQADRQLDADVVAVAGEELVRLNLALDQDVPGRARARARAR